jgi:(S)-ureidoglycine aminohydrolase
MKNASAIVHVSPALGAAFAEYTAEFEPNGELGNTSAQRFVYVMEGSVTLEVKGKRHELGARGYAYLPEGFSHRVVVKEKSRVAVVEKHYQGVEKLEPPGLIVSSEDAVSPHALDGDSDLQVKCCCLTSHNLILR